MPSTETAPRATSARRALVEHLVGGVATDLARSRVAGAAATAPDAPWPTWLVRAADALGWTAERVVAPVRDVAAERDAWWITRAPEGAAPWLVLSTGAHEPGEAVVLEGSGARPVDLDPAALARALALEGPGAEVEWVRVAPSLPLDVLRSPPSPAPALSPLRRLGRWVRLERRAVVAVVAYSAAIGVISLALPLAVQWLVNLLAFGQILQPLLVMSAALFLVLALGAALRVLEVYIVELLQRRAFIDLSRDLARRLPAASPDAGGDWGMTERINRFFDIVGIQKSASTLLLGATEIVMSTAAGLLVLAFYHPYLLVFDVVVVAALAFVVFRLGRGGIPTAVHESTAKYELAAWLESVARRQPRFVTPEGAGWSIRRTDRLSLEWLRHRAQHFSIVLRQTIGFASLQAIASAALLGLGSFLVWVGELSLGQLIAAELIITGVVAQLAKLGKHVETFYDINASVAKVGMLIDLELEPGGGALPRVRRGGMELELERVPVGEVECSLRVPPGARVALEGMPSSPGTKLLEALYGRRPPPGDRGRVRIDGAPLTSLSPRALRTHIAFVGRGMPVGATLEDNLMGGREATADELWDLLARVDMVERVAALAHGLETWVHPDGHPLGPADLVSIDVARVLRARPRLVLVDGALDLVFGDRLDVLWGALTGEAAPWTLLVSTDRPDVAARCERRYRWGARGLAEGG